MCHWVRYINCAVKIFLPHPYPTFFKISGFILLEKKIIRQGVATKFQGVAIIQLTSDLSVTKPPYISTPNEMTVTKKVKRRKFGKYASHSDRGAYENIYL